MNQNAYKDISIKIRKIQESKECIPQTPTFRASESVHRQGNLGWRAMATQSELQQAHNLPFFEGSQDLVVGLPICTKGSSKEI